MHPPPHVERLADLAQAYRLLNTGATVLVSSAHGSARNLMAAAWNMPIEFAPARVAVCIDKSTFTRELVERSGEFTLAVPTRSIADLVFTCGSRSGRDVPGHDKFAALEAAAFRGVLAAPLPDGCAGWLECRLLPESHMQQAYDIFVGEVVAAWADERVFANGKYRPLDSIPAPLRTLHHLGAGQFVVPGEQLQATNRS